MNENPQNPIQETAPTKDWSKVASQEMPKENEHEELLLPNVPKELLEHPSYQKLNGELDRLTEERDQLRNDLLRAKAEADNAAKRFERELTNTHKYAIDRLLTDILPTIDSLERALEIKLAEENDLLKQMRTGIQLTIELLLKTLAKYGVEQINPIGAVFNPTYHEAMSVEERNGAITNTVLRVMQKGYLLKDRLVRPALVIVAK